MGLLTVTETTRSCPGDKTPAFDAVIEAMIDEAVAVWTLVTDPAAAGVAAGAAAGAPAAVSRVATVTAAPTSAVRIRVPRRERPGTLMRPRTIPVPPPCRRF